MSKFKILIILTIIFSVFQSDAYCASAGVKALPSLRESESYTDTGREISIEATLDTTPGTLTTITITDDTIKGFRLYPRTNHIRFAAYLTGSTRTLAAVATDTDNTITSADLAIGGIAKPDMWETRLLPTDGTGTNRVITLRSTTADVVVDVELF